MNLLEVGCRECCFGFLLASGPAPGQEKPSSPTGQMKSTEKKSMDDMMKDCMKHHDTGVKSMDRMNKTLEGAKYRRTLRKMRAAIDQTQKQLAEMKEHMSMCGKMMSMMQKMDGMGGMMKGNQSDR